MTKTLRKRILFTMIVLLSLTFISIICAINIWNRTRNQNVSDNNLRFILQRDFKPDMPQNADPQTNENNTPPADSYEKKIPKPDDRHREIATSQYILARYNADDTLISIKNTLSSTYTDEEIESYCKEILSSGKELGTIYHLRYLKQTNDMGSVIVFVDYSAEEQNNNQLFVISIVLGMIGLILLGFLSYILSGLMVRPIEDAFLKQKQFISDASHELKTPITVVLSNAELLSDQYGENRQISYIKQECDRMHHLVTSLLTLTRLEQTSEKQNDKVEFCLSDALLERILPMESIAYEKGITMESNIEPDIRFYGVKEQLQQLAGILIDNALTYASAHGTITITLKKESHHIRFLVSNTGEPIPESERVQLFERFYRSDKSRSRASGHFGLGLSIAKSIVTNHKGSIHIECANGSTSFIVDFR